MEQETNPAPLHINRITGCARCGGEHEHVDAHRMARPFAPAEAGGLVWTHWAPCPTNGDPILIMGLPDGVGRADTNGSEVRRG